MKTIQQQLKDCQRDLHIAHIFIRELKEGKKDMRAFYQRQIQDLQDKIKELMSDATD